MSLGGRVARFALMAAVTVAVGAGTLPGLLRQATPTEEVISRIVSVPAPRPSEAPKRVSFVSPTLSAPKTVEVIAPTPTAPSPNVEPESGTHGDVVGSIPTAPTAPEPVSASTQVTPPPTLTKTQPAPTETQAAPQTQTVPAPVQTQTEPAPTQTQPEPTSVAATESTAPISGTAPETASAPYPVADATVSAPPEPAPQVTRPLNLAVATTNAAPGGARKPWRKHAENNRAHRRVYVRPKPFSIGDLLAGLRIR